MTFTDLLYAHEIEMYFCTAKIIYSIYAKVLCMKEEIFSKTIPVLAQSTGYFLPYQ